MTYPIRAITRVTRKKKSNKMNLDVEARPKNWGSAGKEEVIYEYGTIMERMSSSQRGEAREKN